MCLARPSYQVACYQCDAARLRVPDRRLWVKGGRTRRTVRRDCSLVARSKHAACLFPFEPVEISPYSTPARAAFILSGHKITQTPVHPTHFLHMCRKNLTLFRKTLPKRPATVVSSAKNSHGVPRLPSHGTNHDAYTIGPHYQGKTKRTRHAAFSVPFGQSHGRDASQLQRPNTPLYRLSYP